MKRTATVLLAPLLVPLAEPGCSSKGAEKVPIGLRLPPTGHLADSGGHAEAAARCWPPRRSTWREGSAESRSLERVRAGEDVDYEGASGAIDFDANGDVRLEKVEFWSVRASEIVR